MIVVLFILASLYIFLSILALFNMYILFSLTRIADRLNDGDWIDDSEFSKLIIKRNFLEDIGSGQVTALDAAIRAIDNSGQAAFEWILRRVMSFYSLLRLKRYMCPHQDCRTWYGYMPHFNKKPFIQHNRRVHRIG
jgi:hypothetical protein